MSRTTVYKYIGILQIKKQPFGCFFGADDGTFVAARCSFGLFRWAEKPSAPRLLLLPTKPAALWGLLLSWVQVRIMQKKHLSLRGAFLPKSNQTEQNRSNRKQKQCEVRTARWRLSKRIRSIFLLLTRKKSEQDLPAEIHSGTLYERAPCPSKELFPDSESPV